MPTYYVEDYDGPRDDEPAVEAKVVEAPSDTKPVKKTTAARTKAIKKA